ncbi:Fungal specific transcription factor domain-containing protein [Cladophialophora immunda]|nr:Fungal specific transcription factor domain-containing protein [Cladophialophora immunda]
MTDRPSTELQPLNESGGSTATRDVSSASPSAKAATDGHHEDTAASRRPRRRSATIQLPSFIRPLSSRIGHDEVSYLSSKGAFWLPSAKDLLALVDCYAHFVHPFNPFLDIKNLRDVCHLHANPSEGVTQARDRDRISLLTLNAVLGAATSYVDTACIKRMEFASRTAARDTFYMRAKSLYDLDCESDLFSVQQALVLMTYWVGIPATQKDTWHWNGLAVNTLQSTNLQEPTSTGVITQRQSRKLQRRLWWSCFIRDACLALGLRCAPRMKFDERTTTMVTLDDFDEIPVGVYQGESMTGSCERSYVAERTLAVTFVQMAKLCLIINGIQAFVSGPSKTSSVDTSAAPCCSVDHAMRTSFVTKLFGQRLQSWLADLPPECSYSSVGQEDHGEHHFDRLEARVKVHVVLVNMFYYSVVCHLHFPQLLKETGNGIGRLYCETMTTSIAANMVRAAVDELTKLAAIVIRDDLIDHLPAASCSALMPATVVHLAIIHSKSSSKEPIALQSLGTYLRVFAGMVAKYECARLLMHRFGESLNDAGLRLDDVLLNGPQQLQTTTSSPHLASAPACTGTVYLTDFTRDGAGPQGLSLATHRSSAGMTEDDGTALGQTDHRARQIDSSMNLPSVPNLVPAESYDFLGIPDDSPVPAVQLSGIELRDDISDTMEPPPSSYLLEALDKSLMLPHYSDFSFENFDDNFSNNLYTPFDIGMACDHCRKRKCDNQPQTCSNCKLYNIVCTYSHDRRRRWPVPRLQGNVYRQTHHARTARKSGPPEPRPTANQNIVTENDSNSTDEPGSTIELDDSNDGPTNGGLVSQSVDLPTRKVLDSWMEIVDGRQPRENSPASYASDRPQTSQMDFTERRSVFLDPHVSNRSDTTRAASLAAGDHLQLFLPGSAGPSQTSLLRPSSVNDVAVSSNYRAVGISNKSTTEHGAPVPESLPGHWATRTGVLQQVGRGDLRYFGVTSNLDLDQNAPMYGLYQSKGRRFRNSCEEILGSNGLHWVGDEEFEDYLTAQFFLWENPLLNILNESIYFQEKARFEKGEDTNLYSLLLNNAIYALGAFHSTRPFPAAIPANTKDDFFAARAKALVDLEMDHPTLATVQALIILSFYEAGRAGDARGWLYSGMAARIGVELGLHIDGQDNIMPVTTNMEMLQLRRGLFWTMQATDVPLATAGLGSNVPSPRVDADRTWEVSTPEPGLDVPSSPAVHRQFCTLISIMAQIQKTFYTVKTLSPQDHLSFVTSMVHQLQWWRESLPLELQINTSSATFAGSNEDPTVLLLHMQYHTIVILLHRTLIAPFGDDLPSQTRSDKELQTCTDSADEICQLLKIYTTTFSTKALHVQSVYVVLTAGLIHVYKIHREQTSKSPGESSTASDNLTTCLQTLGEMSIAFKSSLRALDILLSARRQLSHDW